MKKILIYSAICLILSTNAYSKSEEYLITTNDLLEISVYNEPELQRNVRVSVDGTITYPFIGEVQVKGFSVQAVEQKVKTLLEKDYLVDPQVTVFVKEYNKVYVLGQVEKPGEYDLKGTLTVVEAITMAGGFTKYAAPNRTKVLRKKNGKKMEIPVPVSKVLSKKDKWKDLELAPSDVVIVPESIL